MTGTALMKQIEQLKAAILHLENRVEVLEDLRDLEGAIEENGDKLLIPWSQTKQQLELN